MGVILSLSLRQLKSQFVVTFHSVLPEPNNLRKNVVKFIGEKSAGIIVMADVAVDILNKDYGISRSKIHVIRHGIPTLLSKQANH